MRIIRNPAQVAFEVPDIDGIKANGHGNAGISIVIGAFVSQHVASRYFWRLSWVKFAAQTHEEAYEVLRWILFDNHKFTARIASYRAGYFVAPGVFAPDVMAFLKKRMLAAFDILNIHLGQNRFVGGGETLTIADFSLAGYLFYSEAELGVDITVLYPNVAGWLKHLRGHPTWRGPYDLMPNTRLC